MTATGRLGDLVSFQSGCPFKSALFNTDGVGMPLARIRDVVPGRSGTYYSGAYEKTFVLADGDYLIGMDGEFNLARWRGGPALLNQRVCKLDQVSDALDLGYLARFLPSVLKAIEMVTPFATVKHLSIKSLREIEIPLPPLDEQRRIAAILDQADALRAKRHAALAYLDDLTQSIFSDIFGDPLALETDPERQLLVDILAVPLQNGAYYPAGDYADEGIEMVHMSDAFYGVVPRGALRRVGCSSADRRKYALDAGDLLVARRSLNYDGSAKPCMIPDSDEPLIFESSLIRVTPDPARVTPLFLYHYLNNRRVREKYVFPVVTGTTISGINQKALAGVPVLVPSMGQQIAFGEQLAAVDRMKCKFELQQGVLGVLFESLQSRAFAGVL